MTLCKYFAEGKCKKAHCKFSHDAGVGGSRGRGGAGQGSSGKGFGRGKGDTPQSQETGKGGGKGGGGKSGGSSSGRGETNDAARRFFDKMVKSGDRFTNPVPDARKFLEAAAGFTDGADMLYRLVNPADHGEKQVRAAMSADASAAFLNEVAHPFLERLGSDELYIGTARQPMEQLLDTVYTCAGFVSNLCAKIEVAGTIRDPTPFGWFILNVAGRKSEARSNEHVRRIADALSAQELPIAQRLQTLLDDGPSATTAAAAGSLSDERDLPGGRHDNDAVRFRDVLIVPTIEEVLCERPAYLPEPLPVFDGSLSAAALQGAIVTLHGLSAAHTTLNGAMGTVSGVGGADGTPRMIVTLADQREKSLKPENLVWPPPEANAGLPARVHARLLTRPCSSLRNRRPSSVPRRRAWPRASPLSSTANFVCCGRTLWRRCAASCSCSSALRRASASRRASRSAAFG